MQDNGYSNDFFNKLRSSLNIVNVVSKYLPLKKKGRTYWACCPFHHEKTPSFAVNEVEQFYHCFGCGESGDVFTFVRKIEGYDFMQAVQTLAQSINMPVPEFNGDEEIIKRKKHKDKLFNICLEAANYYHQQLYKPVGKQALEYLKSRQINDETVKSMLLGYSGDWSGLINHLHKLGYTNEDIKQAGLVGQKQDSIYDAMKDRLIFPIYNHQGRICGFSGRALKNDAYAKYKNTEETEIFKKSFILFGINNLRKARVEDKNYAIMVEGQIDVVSLYQAGFKNAIASLGTSFNKYHLETIEKFVDSIYICFDGDSAGIKATERSLELLKNTNFDVKVITMPNKMDPDEFIKANGKEAFKQAIENAIPVKEFEINRLVDKYNLQDKNNLPKFIEASINLISTFKNINDRDIYLKLVAKKANTNEEILRRQLNKKLVVKQAEGKVTKQPVLKTNKLEQAEVFVIACKMFKKPFAKNLESSLFENTFYSMFNQYLIDKNPLVADVLEDFNIDNNEYIKKIVQFNFDLYKEEEKQYKDCVKQLELRKLLKQQTELQIKLQTATADEKIIILTNLQKIIKEIQTKKVED